MLATKVLPLPGLPSITMMPLCDARDWTEARTLRISGVV